MNRGGMASRGAHVGTVFLSCANDTGRLGEIAGRLCLKKGTIFALSGELGAGKTTFAQGLARGLGVTEPVSSPTFTMMNEYESGRLPFFHLDLYRLSESEQGAHQLLALELDEVMDLEAVVVVEWAELGGAILAGRPTVFIEFAYEGAGRKALLYGTEEVTEQLAAQLAQAFAG